MVDLLVYTNHRMGDMYYKNNTSISNTTNTGNILLHSILDLDSLVFLPLSLQP
jgi:hypothetical protein